MPPKAKITKEMIVDAAFAVAREEGGGCINARSVAARLGCSTQPVMHHFPRMETLRRAAFMRADAFHTEYLLQPPRDGQDPRLSIGRNYIRFAKAEPNLFRFLFQSDLAAEMSLPAMMDSKELEPVLSAMQLGADPAAAREMFTVIALFAHGYASLVANNSLEYDEETVSRQLARVYQGAVLAERKEDLR